MFSDDVSLLKFVHDVGRNKFACKLSEQLCELIL